MEKLNTNLIESTNLTTQVLDEFQLDMNKLYGTIDDNEEIVELGIFLVENNDELDVID